MSKYKVVITDCNLGSNDIERETLNDVANIYVYQCKTEKEVINVSKDADALIVQYAPITRRVILSLKKCKIISRYGIGVDNIDVKSATEHKILVSNVKNYCIDEVSDHTIALILACIRKIVLMHTLVHKGIWDFKLASPVYNLKNKILGLIGFGSIARQVSLKALVFGFKVIAYDPYVSSDVIQKYHTIKVDLEPLLRESDVISLHLPLNTKTKHLIGEKELKMMKRSAFLINTSRGGLIDEEALQRALKEKWIEGAGLDVIENEPISLESNLLSLDNLIVTPHMGFYSETSLEILKKETALNVAKLLKGEKPDSILNPEILEGN